MSASPARPFNVLFLCTGNSARSIIAEVLLNTASIGRGRFAAHSAGSFPTGQVNPHARELLDAQGLPTRELRSKSWDEFAREDAAPLDFVITVCDRAAGEMCPVWPGQPMTAHWGVADPAAVEGTDEQKRHAFFAAYSTLRRRIELFASLPLEKLDRLALEERVRAIGRE